MPEALYALLPSFPTLLFCYYCDYTAPVNTPGFCCSTRGKTKD